MKIVNWSFFKNFLNEHFDWRLNYKRYSYSDWTEGNQYLSIGKVWNDSGFYKITLTLNVPIDIFSARLTFGTDLDIKDYFDRDDYEIWLNYTIPNTDEVYNLMFNWSDLKDVSGLQFSKGFNNNIWWFRIEKSGGINAGIYTFDPSFGDAGLSGTTGISIENWLVMGLFQMNAESGTVSNITLKLNCTTAAKDARAGIWTMDRCILCSSEQKSVSVGSYQTIVFNVNSSPVLNASEWYYVGVNGLSEFGSFFSHYQSSVGDSVKYIFNTYSSGLPIKLGTLSTQANSKLACYCSYNVSGDEDLYFFKNTFNFNFSFSNTSLSVFKNTLNHNFSFSNQSFTWKKPLIFNMSFSNQTFSWKKPLMFNLSFSNTTFKWRTPYNFNFSFSNQTFVWKQPFRFNMSFSNSTFIWRQPFNFNFSFSNTSLKEYKNALCFNMSFSNTSISNYKNTLNFNMSFSNTSIKSYQNVLNFNMSFSNQSFVWKQPMSFNFSFSNSSINIFKQPYSFNMSFSNSTFIWKRPLMFNFSFSNTAVYKGGLWFNMSFSNTSLNATMSFNFSFSNSSMDIIIISNVYPGNNSNNIPLQPTIYATINNTYGNKMNISWYYGDSLTNCINILGQDLNITNSTQYELHFNASARSTIYYYRIMANDGTNWVNESFTFRTEGYPGGGISPNYGTPLGIAAAALVLSVFGIIALFKRKKRS